MSEVIFLDPKRFAGRPQSESTLTRQPRPRVIVREAHAGLWLVHDENDRKGGCFKNRETAFRFVEDEFGPRAEILIQPRFPVHPRQRVAHIKHTASVAHRATAP
jgi:hypothetical protein